jgi:hypothetical protein
MSTSTFSTKMILCNICLDNKEGKDMVAKLPSSQCECSFSMCIDCALKCDNYKVCNDADCPNVHSECPQCKQQVNWPGCVSEYVLSNPNRLGFLFKKARQQYQEMDEISEGLIDKLKDLPGFRISCKKELESELDCELFLREDNTPELFELIDRCCKDRDTFFCFVYDENGKELCAVEKTKKVVKKVVKKRIVKRRSKK